MLSRKEIEERLEYIVFDDKPWGDYDSERDALQTAQQLGEWLDNTIKGEDVAAIWVARKWLEGDDAGEGT
jgi:hypothetical protein